MGSYQWGDNGFGACDPGLGAGFSDGVTGPGSGCAQALSGWVDVKPWTIYEATFLAKIFMTVHIQCLICMVRLIIPMLFRVRLGIRNT